MTRHLLVIGGQRCGTTYLAQVLDTHRQIAMNRPIRPEPKVFLDDAVLDTGLKGYHRTLFAHATDEDVLGEKSTSYIEHPSAISRVQSLLGTPTVVAQLRDPVARAISNYRFTCSFGLEDRTLEEAITENLEGPRDWDPDLTSVSPYAYLERGRYADHLAPWLAAFPGRVHVCFFEEITAPGLGATSAAALYDAVGVDPAAAPPLPSAPVNASRGAEPDLPASLVAALRDYFKDSDAALVQHLDRPLPWTTSSTPRP